MKWYEKQKKVYEQSLDVKDPTTPSKEDDKILHKDVVDSDFIVESEPFVNNDATIQSIPEEPSLEALRDTTATSDIIEAQSTKIKYIDDNIDENAYEETITPKAMSTSTIIKNTQLIGNLNVDGYLNIYGDVIGDITCGGDIRLYGTIEGNIECVNLYVLDASIHGDITCSKSMDIVGASIIKGNITAQNLNNEGTILGDLIILQNISLEKAANVEGTICAQTIEVQNGSQIKGSVTIVNTSEQMKQ